MDAVATVKKGEREETGLLLYSPTHPGCTARTADGKNILEKLQVIVNFD
jgi:hypothetical protein